MTEPREALATSICSTFDMGHHHHEAFLQPDHCDDGLSDADELLRSLRAQGYSVARSEGPGLDAPSLDEGLQKALRAALEAEHYRNARAHSPGFQHSHPGSWASNCGICIAKSECGSCAALAQEGETQP